MKNINALNDTGETQLDVAIRENNTKLIKFLKTMVEKRRIKCLTTSIVKSRQATILNEVQNMRCSLANQIMIQ